MQNFREWLHQQAENHSDHTLYQFLQRGEFNNIATLSFADLLSQAQGVASHLSQRFPVGSRLVLLYEPGLDFVVAFWACMYAGMVAVPSYPPGDKRTRERFLGICKDAQATAVLTTENILKKSKLVKWFVSSLRRMKWVATDLPFDANGTYHDFSPNSPALLQYTSGSTSAPKGVILSQANLLYNAQCLNTPRLLAQQEDRFVCWLPFYHDMGLMSGIILPLIIGQLSTLMSPLHFLQKPIRWLRALSETRGTISAAPNFAYEICIKKVKPEQVTQLDLSSWRVALNGAEAIRPETLRNFAAHFKPAGFDISQFYPSYGLAESTVFVTGGIPGELPQCLKVSQRALQEGKVDLSPTHEDCLEIVGVGQSWRNHRFKIVDPESHLETDHVGEVWLQGSSIGQGYWEQPEQSQKMFQAHIKDQEALGYFLRTGDLGFKHNDQLFLTGRLKEMLIIRGQNYAPHTLEHWAEQAHPDLRPGCSAAFSVDQPEKAVLVAEVRKTAQSSATEIIQAIRTTLSEHTDLPLDDVILIQQGNLPKTSSGKIQRKKTALLYGKKHLKLWRKP